MAEFPNNCPDPKCVFIPYLNKLIETNPNEAQEIITKVCLSCVQLAKNYKTLQRIEDASLSELRLTRKVLLQPQK